MKHIIIREYARLTTEKIAQESLDLAHISSSAFDWLWNMQREWGKRDEIFLHGDGAKSMRLANYVGVLESPCGTCIEILPKTHEQGQDIEKTRDLLMRMLCVFWGVPREAEWAHIRCTANPLMEWIIQKFLQELMQLLKQGLRAQYNPLEEERVFIRGQIHMERQARQLAHKQHLTHVRHRVFSLDRPENRLLRSALERCHQITKSNDNWRSANKLRTWMNEIPCSKHIKSDFAQWENARPVAHYQNIKLWCSLILDGQVPKAVHGSWQGLSLLFPMEKVFESFVAHSIRQRLQPGSRLYTQSSAGKHLCTYQEKKLFRLIPDMRIEYFDETEKQRKQCILDAKWKLLDAGNQRDKYGLSQADFYQLFAYGHTFLNGKGELVLVYPRTENFVGMAEPFYFSPELKLFVLACDLERGDFLLDGNVVSLSNNQLIFKDF